MIKGGTKMSQEKRYMISVNAQVRGEENMNAVREKLISGLKELKKDGKILTATVNSIEMEPLPATATEIC